MTQFSEFTLGYDIRVPTSQSLTQTATLYRALWPSIFPYNEYNGPNQNLFVSVEEMIKRALPLPLEELLNSIAIEVTQLFNSEDPVLERAGVQPLPNNSIRSELLGYEVADYFLSENGGPSKPLWKDVVEAEIEREQLEGFYPEDLYLYAIYKLHIPQLAPFMSTE